MKSLIIVGLIVSLNSFAAAPKVTCSSLSYKTTASGAAIMDSFKRVDDVAVDHTVKSIAVGIAMVSSQLRQVCAADMGPCSDFYELITSLKINDSESATSSIITPTTEKNFRQHLNLKAGQYSVFINCDKE